jgi:hypothetical protein
MTLLQAADPIETGITERWPASPRGQEILQHVTSAPPRHNDRKRTPRHALPRFAFPALAVIAAIIAAVLVVPISGTREGASAEAAEVLHAAARVAEKQPPITGPADGFRYTKSKAAYRAHFDVCSFPGGPGECPAPPPDDWEFSVLGAQTREIWIAPDGSGRLRVKSGEPTFFGPEDEAEWEAAGRPQLNSPGISDNSYGPGGLSYTDFSGYSTDTDDLYDQIRERAEGYGPSTDAEMLVLVGDLLREQLAPPDLRAALFRVAARIPGVELVGDVTDPAGRNGIAVARTSDDAGFLERNELIFDPDTSELLAERQVLLERVEWADAEPGTVIGYAVYLESGVVETTSERP